MGRTFPVHLCFPVAALRSALRCLLAVLACLFVLALPGRAQAQTTLTFTNTTSGAIGTSASPCTAPLVRSFSVSQSFTISDVNIGVRVSHNNRGEMRFYLVSPSGTVVTLQENIGGNRDHLNVLFDDSAAASITTHTASNDSATSGPPYQRTFSPQGSLASFIGENSAGTWELRICDSNGATNGTFSRSDLYLSGDEADLSLTKSVSNAAPAFGAAISYTLTVTNAAASSLTATGVTVLDALPAGFSYTSHSAGGGSTYSTGTGVWNVGSLAPGASRTLTINGTVSATAGAVITNIAEITASSAADFDSAPNNGATGEDDYAAVSFTVSGARVAGTPPTLVCPAGTLLHDWDSVAWTAGSTNNSYTVAGLGSVNFAVSISGGVFLNNATYGGQSPARQNVVNGGFTGQFSIFQLVNMTSQTGTATTVVTLPNGIEGAQFRIFDIDFSSGQFADRITVTGSFAGSPVTPTLTNGVSNYVIGNSAYGDASSADASANGNLVVTFSSPIDTITIDYGNHSTAPVDPGQQAIALHDLTFCRPVANLSVTKSSTIISDPQNGATNPKAIPGAVIEYCITVTNPSSGTASNIIIGDAIPATLTFVPGSIRSGTSCAAAATVEDDNNSGTDESDPNGASISGASLTGTATSIGPNSNRAFVFRATVN